MPPVYREEEEGHGILKMLLSSIPYQKQNQILYCTIGQVVAKDTNMCVHKGPQGDLISTLTSTGSTFRQLKLDTVHFLIN